LSPSDTERPPVSSRWRSPGGTTVIATAVGVAVGIVLGIVLGDLAFSSTPRTGELERLAVPAAVALAEAVAPEPPVLAERQVRNVVLLIGDGMGLAQLAAGRILARGIDGRFHLERFPTLGLLTTHPAGGVVTMSDAAATALATGVRVASGAISMDPAGRPLPTLLEVLRDSGWATGLATTTRITDATPAAFAAHVAARRDEAKIAEQLSAAGVDLLVGGGRGFFLPRYSKPAKPATPAKRATPGSDSTDSTGGGGRDLMAEMRARGVAVLDDPAGFEAATRLPIAALFAVEPQQSELRSPTSEAMARKAIELLADSGRPFFLVVEDEGIDTAAHANDGARMSGALRRFDGAVAAAAAFAARDGETLVLVLGDHATGGLTIDARSGEGKIGLLWGSRRHTGEPVPLFAYGPPSAAGRFAGMHDNTEIPGLVAAALGVEFPRPIAAR